MCNQDVLKDFKSPSVGFYQSFCQSLNKYTPFTPPFLCGSEGFSVLKVRHCCSPDELVQIIAVTAGQELMQLMGTHGKGIGFGISEALHVRLGLSTALEEDEGRLDLLWGFTVTHFMVMKPNPQPWHVSRLSAWIPLGCAQVFAQCWHFRGPAEQVAQRAHCC